MVGRDRSIGYASINAPEELRGSAKCTGMPFLDREKFSWHNWSVKLSLTPESLVGVLPDTQTSDSSETANIHLSLEAVDALAAAHIHVENAEQSADQIAISGDYADTTISTIGSIILGLRDIVEVIDNVASVSLF